MGMFGKIGIFLALRMAMELSPSKDTLEMATTENIGSPVANDIEQNKLVIVKIITISVNPEHIDDVNKIPEWVKIYAINQASSSSGNNSKNYNFLLGSALAIHPGYTDDPNNTVLHHSALCELQQAGKCPEGYKKVYVDNFRPRSIEELKRLFPGGNTKDLPSKVKGTVENDGGEQKTDTAAAGAAGEDEE